jgi:putative sigma-54 modulation protein
MVTEPAVLPAPGVTETAGGPIAQSGRRKAAMQVRIHSHGFHTDEDIRRQIERRLELSLGRFGHRINEVRVWLTDDNGPRGGVDKSVRLELDLAGTRSLRIEQIGTTWQEAVDMAAGRMGRTAAREIDRRRNRRLQADLAMLAG